MQIDRKELLHRAGQGNWRIFAILDLDLAKVMDVAKGWRAQLDGVERPWLCWNVDEDWCLVQQALVRAVGWTPVVGYDPRVGPPRHKLPETIVIDFNRGIDLPVLYPHFPLEFVFLFADRLAFWHSDLLVRLPLLHGLARRFERLEDGVTAATWVSPGLRHLLTTKRKRYWELVGCTTRGASRHQFETGCGWWMGWWMHPNCPDGKERARREKRYYWDHGGGIYFWHKVLGGRVELIDGVPLAEGHCSQIGNPDYKRSWAQRTDAQRLMKTDLHVNYDLREVCCRLDVLGLLESSTNLLTRASACGQTAKSVNPAEHPGSSRVIDRLCPKL